MASCDREENERAWWFMIRIKAWFGKWKTVSKEQAKRFVKAMRSGNVCMNDNEFETYMNEKHLKGITVKESMKGCDEE